MRPNKFDVIRNNIDNVERWSDCLFNYIESYIDSGIELDGMIVTAIEQMVISCLNNLTCQVDDLERMIKNEK